MTPEVAIVVSPREWAERLHRHLADHGGARVRARIVDGREALAERYHVLVADDLTSFLTPRLVDQLHRDGRRVLGVWDPLEPHGRQRLEELGADEVRPASTGPDELLRAIELLTLAATADLDAELRGLGDRLPTPAGSSAPEGRLVVVGGPAGGTGSTEVAIGVAAALAGTDGPTVLVDADDVAPALAQRLDLALHPNLRTALDALQHADRPLAPLLHPVAADLVALPGIAAGRDWTEVRPGEALDVLTELCRGHRTVVVDVGHLLEEVGTHGAPHGRYALSRAVIAAADVLVAVAAATPVGATRLLEWLADVRALGAPQPHVVFNRSPVSPFRRGELDAEVARSAAVTSVTHVPPDRRVEEAAWDGSLVRRGGFTKAIAAVARRVGTRRAVGRREVTA